MLPEAQAPQPDYDVHYGASNSGLLASWSCTEGVLLPSRGDRTLMGLRTCRSGTVRKHLGRLIAYCRVMRLVDHREARKCPAKSSSCGTTGNGGPDPLSIQLAANAEGEGLCMRAVEGRGGYD